MAKSLTPFDLTPWVSAHPRSVISQNAPLARLTTLHIGGAADVLAEVADENDLKDLLALSQERAWPVFVLGGGSNVLFGDQGYKGLVLRLGAGFRETSINGFRLTVGAGTPVSAVLRLAQEHNLSGLEPLVGLPGTLGGAVKGNAGGRQGTIGKRVSKLRFMELDGTTLELTKADLSFGYRSLKMKPQKGVILEVELSLYKDDPLTIQAKMEANAALRLNQPKGRTAGCVFKNPVRGGQQISAGLLIELCGLKGHRIGGAQISHEHGNFIINVDNATSDDVLALMREMSQQVYERFERQLAPEIIRPGLGRWDKLGKNEEKAKAR
ncbi:MAG: UDP-N-acetylmuramate dehydrogenase [Deltaproteobacteria bacterium]|jgi:UDP-N-acetylmuramate dehydrogenase|nr:UDP-N-acetylmuramate dehydrogenase [Deltaproteobacteria bacterium]